MPLASSEILGIGWRGYQLLLASLKMSVPDVDMDKKVKLIPYHLYQFHLVP